MASVMEEIQGGGKPSDLISTRRQKLHELIARFDAVHLLAHVQLGETLTDPDSYNESETSGSAYIVELVAAEMLSRATRAGTVEYTPAIDANILEPIRELAREAALLEVLRRQLGSGRLDSPEGMARARAAGTNLIQRGPSWPWQEHQTLRGLFAPKRFAEKLEHALGFNADDAIRCCEAAASLLNQRLGPDREAFAREVANFGPGSPAYEWAELALRSTWKNAGSDDLRSNAITAIWRLNHIGDALLLTAHDLCEGAAVDEGVAASFLAALSSSIGESDGQDWFSLAEGIRFHPYIEFEPGRYYLTLPGNDLWSLRPLFEATVGSERYYRHRATWLEQRVCDLLTDALKPDEAYTEAGYVYDDEGDNRSSDIDVLLRCDDTAIIVEAKSATLRAGARRGGEALITHVRENIVKAAEQGTRAKQALATTRPLRIANQEVSLGATIREVHPIVVTLDDLSSVATVLWQLEGSDVMPQDVTLPWLLTLYELELVCMTLEHPASLIHFLRRRSRLNQIGRYFAHDELDWWMHYLTSGLYFENNPQGEVIRFTSLTDPLDAWVLYEHCERTTPAAKPALDLDHETTQTLRLLAEERAPGWVAASCLMLEPNGDSRTRLWSDVRAARERAARRGKVQRLVHGYTEGTAPMMISAVASPEVQAERLLELVEAHVSELFAKFGEQSILALGSLTSSTRPFDAFVVVERSWWEVDQSH